MPLKRVILDYDDEDIDEVLMERNSIVKQPAHGRNVFFFNDQRKEIKFSIDEEKRIVVGVAIEANKPIFRRANNQLNEDHEVVFTAQTIEKIRDSFHKSNNIHKLNENHQGKDNEDVTLIQSYIIGGKENPKAPEIFAEQDLQDGTWIVGYKVNNDKLWQKIKQGDFSGFSVEVYLDYQSSKFNNQNQIIMKKNKFSIKEFLKELVKSSFEEVTGMDGVVYSYEGEFAIGTKLEIVGEEGNSPASDIEDVVEIDGVSQSFKTDADGVITALADVVEEPEIAEEIIEGFAVALREMNSRITALEKENAKFKAELSKKAPAKKTVKKFEKGKSPLDLIK